jgi:ABC-type antimicrobial peptide transport system permease subunit
LSIPLYLVAGIVLGALAPAPPTLDSSSCRLGCPVSLTLIVAAVALALLRGLLAGAVGSFRAARLRPADALRHID